MNDFRRAMLVAATVLTIVSPTNTIADVYKCTNPGGLVTYQDEPCRNARNAERLAIEPLPVSAEDAAAAREAAAVLRQRDKELAERLQRDTDSRRALAAATPPISTEQETRDDARDSGRTIFLPYQPGVWRAGVYYPPQDRHLPFPFGNVHDPWHPGHRHHPAPPDGNPPPPPQSHSKLGHSKDDPSR